MESQNKEEYENKPQNDNEKMTSDHKKNEGTMDQFKKKIDFSSNKANSADETQKVDDTPKAKQPGCIERRLGSMARNILLNEETQAALETVFDGMMKSPTVLTSIDKLTGEITEKSITKALDKVSEKEVHEQIVKIATEIAEDSLTPLIEREKRKIAKTAVAVAGAGVAATIAIKSGRIGNGVAAIKKLYQV